MNLSYLNFLRTLRSDTKQYAVIGLGRFGSAVCSTLHNLNYEVLALDNSETLVNRVIAERTASHSIRIDTTDPNALKEAGVFEFETAIVAIGNYIEESIITTLNLKEGGVKHVVAKASSEIHMKLLKRVGADHVVFPEREMGCMLARSLTRPRVLEQFELDPENSIVEISVPTPFIGKTVAELDLRKRYGLNVLAVSKNDKFEINPTPQHRLTAGSALVVLGTNKDIDRLPI